VSSSDERFSDNIASVSHATLQIDAHIVYSALLAHREHERDARLHIYPTQSFSPPECVPLVFPCEDDSRGVSAVDQRTEALRKRMHHVRMSFSLTSTDCDELLRECSLNLSAFAYYRNSQGDWVRNQCGFASLSLVELVLNAGKPELLEVPLYVPQSKLASKQSKGVVLLSVNSLSVVVEQYSVSEHGDDKTQSVHVLSEDDVNRALKHYNPRERSLSAKSHIEAYIETVHAFYSMHRATLDCLRNITVFRYRADTGCVPGALFDMFRIPLSKEEYYLHALSVVVSRRHGIDWRQVNLLGEHWLDYTEKQNSATVVNNGKLLNGDGDGSGEGALFRTRTAMDMLCVYVVSCAYITDLTDYNRRANLSSHSTEHSWDQSLVELMDSFDVMRVRDGGDCEDFTREILQEAMEIKYGMRAPVSSILQEVKRIFERFLFFSELCGVSNRALAETDSSSGAAKGTTSQPGATKATVGVMKSLLELVGLGDSGSGDAHVHTSQSAIHLNGHEAAFAIPKCVFYDALARAVSPTHPLLADLAACELEAGRGDIIYVLEGTGKLEPEPSGTTHDETTLEQALQSAATALSSLPDTRNVTTLWSDRLASTYHYRIGKACFYKMMITLITPEFYLSRGLRIFATLACERNVEDGGSYTRGVWFDEMVNLPAHPNVCILPYPEMPEEVLRESMRICDNDHPVPPLTKAHLLPSMIEFAEQCSCKPTPSLIRRWRLPTSQSHTTYLRFDQVDAQTQQDLLRLATTLGVGIDIFPEPIAQCMIPEDDENTMPPPIGVYRIVFFT